METRVVVADGQWLVRQGLRAALEYLPDCKVVGEASTVQGLLQEVQESLPDLVMIDLHLPHEGGLEALRQVKEACPQAASLMLGDESTASSVRDALRVGCNAFVRKNAGSLDLLLEAIRQVRAGNLYLDAELTRALVLEDHRREAAEDESPLRRLTDRERLVFDLIGAGFTNRAAAERIHLSHKTIEKHRAAVMQKLQLRSAFELRLLAQSLSDGKSHLHNP